jgi:glycosyltransferase involved in cell wall biosynthesis
VRTFRYAPERFEQLGYGRSLVADERPRLVAGLVAPLYLLGAARALRRAIAADRPDLVHLHWIVPNGVAAAVPGSVPRTVPVAIGIHGSDAFLAEKPAMRPLVRRALGRCALLTGCSAELVDRVHALGKAPVRREVLPYGVDCVAFSPDPARRGSWRHSLGIPDAAPMVLGVGRMATKKGFQVLVRALPSLLARFPAAHVVLAGGGDLEPELRAATAAWRDRVHFPGSVGRDALPDLFRAADVFVLPAVHDARGNVDGLPNVILEAMASGLPVVATVVSGIPLAVTSGREGILVAEHDAAALERALAELLDDAGRRNALGAAARRRVLAELTWDHVAARYRAAYRPALTST